MTHGLFTDVIIMCLCLDRSSNTLAVYAGSENQKYLKLCSEDERMSDGLEQHQGEELMTIFIFGSTIPLIN